MSKELVLSIQRKANMLGDPDFEPKDLFQFWESRDQKPEIEENVEIKEYKDRNTAGFLYQMWLFFIRGLIQHIRDWPSLILDATLVCLAGIFLGVVFNNSTYEGPPERSACSAIQVEALYVRCELPLVELEHSVIVTRLE